jgi:hypothetical protein
MKTTITDSTTALQDAWTQEAASAKARPTREEIHALEEGEPFDVVADELQRITEAADRIADHAVTRADYDLSCYICKYGRAHPGWRAALDVAYAWETDPETAGDY